MDLCCSAGLYSLRILNRLSLLCCFSDDMLSMLSRPHALISDEQEKKRKKLVSLSFFLLTQTHSGAK